MPVTMSIASSAVSATPTSTIPVTPATLSSTAKQITTGEKPDNIVKLIYTGLERNFPTIEICRRLATTTSTWPKVSSNDYYQIIGLEIAIVIIQVHSKIGRNAEPVFNYTMMSPKPCGGWKHISGFPPRYYAEVDGWRPKKLINFTFDELVTAQRVFLDTLLTRHLQNKFQSFTKKNIQEKQLLKQSMVSLFPECSVSSARGARSG